MAWISPVAEVVQVAQVKDRAGAWIYGSRPGAPGAPKVLFYVFMVLLAYSVFSYFFIFFPISRLFRSPIYLMIGPVTFSTMRVSGIPVPKN